MSGCLYCEMNTAGHAWYCPLNPFPNKPAYTTPTTWLAHVNAAEEVGYARGLAAGLEQAAGVCEARAVHEREKAAQDMDADSCGRALSREAAARWCAAAIRAVAQQPPPTGGHLRDGCKITP